jgi:triacylglycerol lipase
MNNYVFQADITKFVPLTTAYHGENALALVDCARLAYQESSVISQALVQQWGFTHYRYFSRKGTQAFVAANNELIIVAFRGTEPKKLRDWHTDAKVIQSKGPAGKVHRGFKKALEAVWHDRAGKPGVRSSIDEFQDTGQSVWVTGHSLGAALATLAVAELCIREDRPVNGLYTIGQPRVGDRKFAAEFNAVFRDRCFRFINNNDLVTRVPPRKLNYSHVGRPLYIDSNARLHDDMAWWNQFLDRIKGVLQDIGDLGPDGIKDHDAAEYVQLIQENRRVNVRF